MDILIRKIDDKTEENSGFLDHKERKYRRNDDSQSPRIAGRY